MSTLNILLQPRPYARHSGQLLLLPLLPQRKPLKPLPSEVWSQIFSAALDGDRRLRLARSLLLVCKAFKEIVHPLVYVNICISNIPALAQFHAVLDCAEQKWDSIRRIPYSAPGRWVQVLDLSCIPFTSQGQVLILDSLLTQLFPLVPFLSRLSLNPSFVLSRRALLSLASREGVINIRALYGISYIPHSTQSSQEEAMAQLLRSCQNLEELELIGQGDPIEMEFFTEIIGSSLPEHFLPLSMKHLHTLTLLSTYSSQLMLYLLHSPLPSLRKLTITPYDDIPYPSSLVSQFISIHGTNLRSLLLLAVKTWPSRLHTSPKSLLHTSPHLHHLSLETPLPELTIPLYDDLSTKHPLQMLSIPRPTQEFWPVLERLLKHLPSLRAVRARDVRWLRKGMTSRALEAGVQGELREWRRRLNRRGIRVFDADWNEDG